MLIAVSARGDTMDSAMDPRLGRAERFILIDGDTEKISILETGAVQATHGAGIQTAQMLLKAGVKVVISGDCGPKAFQVFQAANVPVYSATSGTVWDAFSAWRRNELPVIGQPGAAKHV